MGQFFRTSTPMGDWRSFKFTHDESGVTYELGELYRIGDTVGLLFLDIKYNADGSKAAAELVKGEKGVLVYHIEKVIVNKVHETGDAFGVGDKVYWSGTQGDPVDPVWQSGYHCIGIATEPALWNAETVEIDLYGAQATWQWAEFP